MSELKERKQKYRPGHFCQAEGCDNPLTMVQTTPSNIKRGGGRFCSPQCTYVWISHNTQVYRAGFFCETCNAPLTKVQTEPSKIKRGGGRFCSKPCWGEWKSKALAGINSPFWQGGVGVTNKKLRPGHFCEICNTPLTMRQTAPNRLKAGFGKTCSRNCQAAWQSVNLRGKNNVHWKDALITRKCEYCEAEHSFYASQSAGAKRRFCSTPCRSAGTSGEKSHMWMGGVSYEPYPSSFNRAFKRKIRARDKHACALCGAADSKDVHHISYIKDDTTPGNCITLCRKCHSKTNYNREHWQAVLTEIMQARIAQQGVSK